MDKCFQWLSGARFWRRFLSWVADRYDGDGLVVFGDFEQLVEETCVAWCVGEGSEALACRLKQNVSDGHPCGLKPVGGGFRVSGYDDQGWGFG